MDFKNTKRVLAQFSTTARDLQTIDDLFKELETRDCRRKILFNQHALKYEVARTDLLEHLVPELTKNGIETAPLATLLVYPVITMISYDGTSKAFGTRRDKNLKQLNKAFELLNMLTASPELPYPVDYHISLAQSNLLDAKQAYLGLQKIDFYRSAYIPKLLDFCDTESLWPILRKLQNALVLDGVEIQVTQKQIRDSYNQFKKNQNRLLNKPERQ